MQQKGSFDHHMHRINRSFPAPATSSLCVPKFYDVVLINDDFTPPDYVLCVLRDIFHMSHDESVHTILSMQHHGEVICGTYTREVAETKMMKVINYSRDKHQPLKCVIRKEPA